MDRHLFISPNFYGHTSFASSEIASKELRVGGYGSEWLLVADVATKERRTLFSVLAPILFMRGAQNRVVRRRFTVRRTKPRLKKKQKKRREEGGAVHEGETSGRGSTRASLLMGNLETLSESVQVNAVCISYGVQRRASVSQRPASWLGPGACVSHPKYSMYQLTPIAEVDANEEEKS